MRPRANLGGMRGDFRPRRLTPAVAGRMLGPSDSAPPTRREPPMTTARLATLTLLAALAAAPARASIAITPG